jgi:bud site selection protein 31
MRLTDQQRRSAPDGWPALEKELDAIAAEHKDAAVDAAGPAARAAWPALRLHRALARHVHDAFFVDRAISRRLYEWCVRPAAAGGGGVAGRELVAKWRRAGYERLCCLGCVQAADTAFGTVCVCRVPRAKREAGTADRAAECVRCGCRGCSGD